MRITIAWPDEQLWPNRPHHWTARNRRRQVQKSEAWALVRQFYDLFPDLLPDLGDGPIPVSLTFCKADRRRYDLDNALAACKGAIDGVALALGVDDSRFAISIVRGEPTPGGAVLVEVSE